MSQYKEQIEKLVPAHDPRHIEAFMRLEYGVLSHLDAATFAREAKIAAACVEAGGTDEAESLAVTYGL